MFFLIPAAPAENFVPVVAARALPKPGELLLSELQEPGRGFGSSKGVAAGLKGQEGLAALPRHQRRANSTDLARIWRQQLCLAGLSPSLASSTSVPQFPQLQPHFPCLV